jgi:WD40 repeat protein
VNDIEFSEDGTTLHSVSSDGTLRVWDTETGQLLSDVNLGQTILSGAFNPGATQLVYSTYSATDVPPTLITFPLTDAGVDQTSTADSK